LGYIAGMDIVDPPVPQLVGQRPAGECKPGAIEIVAFCVYSCSPDEYWEIIEEMYALIAQDGCHGTVARDLPRTSFLTFPGIAASQDADQF